MGNKNRVMLNGEIDVWKIRVWCAIKEDFDRMGWWDIVEPILLIVYCVFGIFVFCWDK